MTDNHRLLAMSEWDTHVVHGGGLEELDNSCS